jgi:carboxypeptidase Taq
LSNALTQLENRLAKVADLKAAQALLQWDQQVCMPAGGAEARADHLATVESLSHSLFIADETGELLERAAAAVAELPYDTDEASLVRVTQREYNKLRSVPADLVAERARCFAAAFEAWVQARADSDFAAFRPHLERVVRLSIEYAEALGYEEEIYDALLDRFEPEMKATQVAALFESTKHRIMPLVRAIAERGAPVDDSFLRQEYPADAQWEFSRLVLGEMGYDFERGRLDSAVHPFTTSMAPGDVRVTTRVFECQPQSALLATVHEGGHALYQQGMPARFRSSKLFDGASYAVHESQARLWENMVARSRPFWTGFLADLSRFFPTQLAGIGVGAFYRALNKVEPSLIRVEADEVTYNLHIFLRFELERDLIRGQVEVADLPDAWNSKMEEYLGLRPPDDATGVLQDVHWANGYVGYFPSYALGNLMAGMFYSQAQEDVAELEDRIAKRDLSGLREWLGESIHRHGRKYTPRELLLRVVGSELDAGPFLDYLEAKYGEIYEL